MNATIGRTVRTTTGNVPGFAVLVAVTDLTWIRGTRRGTVTIAKDDDEDFGRTVWVYAQYDGNPATLVYKGDSLEDAVMMRDAFVKGHEDQTGLMSHSMAGVRIETPTGSVTKTY